MHTAHVCNEWFYGSARAQSGAPSFESHDLPEQEVIKSEDLGAP